MARHLLSLVYVHSHICRDWPSVFTSVLQPFRSHKFKEELNRHSLGTSLRPCQAARPGPRVNQPLKSRCPVFTRTVRVGLDLIRHPAGCRILILKSHCLYEVLRVTVCLSIPHCLRSSICRPSSCFLVAVCLVAGVHVCVCVRSFVRSFVCLFVCCVVHSCT